MKYRVKDEKLLSLYRGKPCVCCSTPGVAHHILYRSHCRVDSEWNLVPMCQHHHRLLHDHKQGQVGFALENERYRKFIESLGWEIDREHGLLLHKILNVKIFAINVATP